MEDNSSNSRFNLFRNVIISFILLLSALGIGTIILKRKATSIKKEKVEIQINDGKTLKTQTQTLVQEKKISTDQQIEQLNNQAKKGVENIKKKAKETKQDIHDKVSDVKEKVGNELKNIMKEHQMKKAAESQSAEAHLKAKKINFQGIKSNVEGARNEIKKAEIQEKKVGDLINKVKVEQESIEQNKRQAEEALLKMQSQIQHANQAVKKLTEKEEQKIVNAEHKYQSAQKNVQEAIKEKQQTIQEVRGALQNTEKNVHLIDLQNKEVLKKISTTPELKKEVKVIKKDQTPQVKQLEKQQTQKSQPKETMTEDDFEEFLTELEKDNAPIKSPEAPKVKR